jgi:hypothetical protein
MPDGVAIEMGVTLDDPRHLASASIVACSEEPPFFSGLTHAL